MLPSKVQALVSWFVSSFWSEAKGSVPTVPSFPGFFWFSLWVLFGFSSIMLCWLFLGPAPVPVLVFFLFPRISLRNGVLFHHDFLVLPGSGLGLPFLPSCLSAKDFCSIMIFSFLLAPARVPVLASLLFSHCFSQERVGQ